MYRIWQFWKAITSRLPMDALEEIQAVLNPLQMQSFQEMSTSDQAHSYRVMKALQKDGYTDRDLWSAALLHDIGKSLYPLRIWERPLPVLCTLFFPAQVRSFAKKEPDGWKRALVISQRHPEWGAEMAARAGASPITVWLIRSHQEDQPQEPPGEQAEEYFHALKQADNQS